jgi:hypothetical protein
MIEGAMIETRWLASEDVDSLSLVTNLIRFCDMEYFQLWLPSKAPELALERVSAGPTTLKPPVSFLLTMLTEVHHNPW